MSSADNSPALPAETGWKRSLAGSLAFLRRRMTGDYQVDDFGYDRDFTDHVIVPPLKVLYEKWFRIETLGMENIPDTPTFPLLGPLVAIPLPSKWIIEFGEPIPTDSYAPNAADDPMVVFNLTDRVRETIQQTLYRCCCAAGTRSSADGHGFAPADTLR